MPRLVWTVSPEGSVWFTDARLYRVINRTMSGDTMRVIDTGIGGGRISASKAAKFKRQMQDAHADVAQFDLAEPHVEGLYFLPDGHLLVQRTAVAGATDTSLDILTTSGESLGQLTVPFRLSNRGLPAIRGDTIIALGIGDLDIPFIVRLIIDR